MTAPDHVADPIISSLRLGGRPHMTHIPSPHATDFVNHVSNYLGEASECLFDNLQREFGDFLIFETAQPYIKAHGILAGVLIPVSFNFV